MTSGGHELRITDDYSKQESLILTPTMISLKQKYFSDIPYPRYQLKRSSGPMMVASCWSGQKEDICPSIKKSMSTPIFLLSAPTVLLSTPIDNSEATQKKATNTSTLIEIILRIPTDRNNFEDSY